MKQNKIKKPYERLNKKNRYAISIGKDTRKALRELKRKGETYSDLLKRGLKL